MANLQLIKDFAEKRKISIRELAEKVGLKENQIHVMCRTNSTKIDTLERIAQVLDVSVTEFFENTTGHLILGDNNQLNEKGSSNNQNIGCASATDVILAERVNSLELIIEDKKAMIAEKEARLKEKDEYIAELKEQIKELKG